MEARFACGSMVLFCAFSQKCCTECNIFVKKHKVSSALPEATFPVGSGTA